MCTYSEIKTLEIFDLTAWNISETAPSPPSQQPKKVSAN